MYIDKLISLRRSKFSYVFRSFSQLEVNLPFSTISCAVHVELSNPLITCAVYKPVSLSMQCKISKVNTLPSSSFLEILSANRSSRGLLSLSHSTVDALFFICNSNFAFSPAVNYRKC